MIAERSGIEVGIGLSPDLVRLDRARMVDLVGQINASNIDHVVVTDHVSFRGGRGQDGLAALHYLAGLGLNCPLHTGVLILPLRHPTIVARQLLDLADVHGPGIVAGVGLGGDDPAEYSMVGMEVADRGRRMDDAVDGLIELLSDVGEVDRAGFYPATGPGLRRGGGRRVEVLVGGRAPASHRRAASADGWLGTFCSPSRFEQGAQRVIERSSTAALGYQAWIGIGSDGRALAAAQIERFYGLDPSLFERYIPTGSAEDIATHLTGYAEAGATVFNLFPAAVDPETAVAEVSQIATNIADLQEAVR